MMHILFLAPPGAGKGTQSNYLYNNFGLKQLSTGDILRINKKLNTPLGQKARLYMDKGELVPDSLMIAMLKDELLKDEYKNGVIFDGFPRTVPQAIALDEILLELNEKLDLAIILEVPKAELISRLSARRVCRKCGKSYHLIFNPPSIPNVCDEPCCGELYQRIDDTKETILNRLNVYQEQTEPLLKYYDKKELTVYINGLGDVNKIFARISKALSERNLIKTNQIV